VNATRRNSSRAGVSVLHCEAGGSGPGAVAATQISSNTPHREVYWGVTRIGWTIYPLLAMLIATLLYLPFRRARYWRLGRAAVKTDNLSVRIRNLTLGAAQHRVPRDRYAGTCFAVWPSFPSWQVAS